MASTIDIIAKFINEASAGLKKLGQDVDEVGKKNEETKPKSDSLTESFLKQAVAGVTVGAVFTAVATGIKATIDAYGEAEVVGAQLDAVLRSTGGAAGMQRSELDALADSLSKMSGVDDEVIAKGEAVMLTFTKVGRDVFPAATEAALNMSAALGQDLQSSIMQVGKALNEPIQGAAALRRVGVQLTDQQEEQIKSFMKVNDIASAQKVILDELAVEFGGTAEAMGNTTVGAANKLQIAWGNLLETIGEGNAKQFKEANEWLTRIIETNTESIQSNQRHEDAIRAVAAQYSMTSAELISYSNTSAELGAQIDNEVFAYQRAVQYGEAWSKALQDQKASVVDVSSAMDEYVPKFDQLLSLSSRISSETESYNEKQNDLMAKQAEVKAQIDELIAQGWSPMGDKVMDLQQKYDDLGIKSQEMAQKHNEAMGKMQYDLLITKLSADGLTDAEYKIAQNAGIMFGVFDQESVDAAKNMDLVSQAVATGKLKVDDMKRALDGLNRGYTIDVVLNVINGLAGYGNTTSQNHVTPGSGRAAGGPVMAGVSYIVGETGPERFVPSGSGSIIPNHQMGGMGGVNVQITIASPVTIMDEQNAQAVLLPMIVEGIRQAQATGAI